MAAQSSTPEGVDAMDVFRYRAVIDFDVRVRPLSRSYLERREAARIQKRVAAGWLPHMFDVPSERELLPLQALLGAILESPETLDRWVVSRAIGSLWGGFALDGEAFDRDPYELLPPLAAQISDLASHRIAKALATTACDPAVDEFWWGFESAPVELRVSSIPGPDGLLTPSADVLYGRRVRAVALVEVRPNEISLARALERHASRRLKYFDALEDPFPLPSEADIWLAQQLQAAVLRSPELRHRLFTINVLNAIRDSGVAGMGPPPAELHELLPLVHAIEPHMRRALPLHDELKLEDALWRVVECFEDETGSVAILDDLR